MVIADWSGAPADQKVADLDGPGVASLLDTYQSDMLAGKLVKIRNTQRVTFGDSRPGPPVVQLWTKASPWPMFSASRESRSYLVEYKKRGQGQD
jgi:hypothetical protein